jgi:hypothetical protein
MQQFPLMKVALTICENNLDKQVNLLRFGNRSPHAAYSALVVFDLDQLAD